MTDPVYGCAFTDANGRRRVMTMPQLVEEREALLAALIGAHQALDHVLAERIAADDDFRPTHHPCWPAVVSAAIAIANANGPDMS
jgi:hypothetical protein